MIENKFYVLMAGVISLLAVATVTGLILKRFAKSEGSIATVDNLNLRINAWWSMIAIFVASYGLCITFSPSACAWSRSPTGAAPLVATARWAPINPRPPRLNPRRPAGVVVNECSLGRIQTRNSSGAAPFG